MKRHCFALDLNNDAQLIAEYEEWHTEVWSEVLTSIKDSGIENLEIYRCADRLFMIMEVNESFSFEKKALADSQNQKVQEWESIMWKFQKPIPQAKPGEKWLLMNKIFEL